MTAPPDAYWDELGVAWCALETEGRVMTARLRSRLRRQSFAIAATLAIGAPLSLAGVLLGLFTIWSGWTTGTWNFLTRGLAIVALSSLAAATLSSWLPVRASAEAAALSDMLDLAVARAERTLLAIRLGFWACGVAAVLGLAGTAIRASLARPPALSPAIDLAVLAVVAVWLFVCRRTARVTLAKFRYLKQATAAAGA